MIPWWFYLIVLIVLYKLYQVWTMGMCTCKTKLTGKVVIVTGANTGIGFETAKDMARRGAKVILACRNHQRGTEAQHKIIESTGNKDVHYKHLDLSSFASVRSFAEDILNTEKRLDILINNAGAAGLNQSKTADGLIVEYQINHYGPFLLTHLLLPLLKSSAPSRIVNLSSLVHWLGTTDFKKHNERIWSDVQVYCNTKICIIYFTKELSRRLQGTGVVTNCVHPGAAKSDIYRKGNFVFRWFSAFYNTVLFKNEWEGAQTSIHVAVSPECETINGEYFSDCQIQYLAPKAKSIEKAKELWDISVKAVGLYE